MCATRVLYPCLSLSPIPWCLSHPRVIHSLAVSRLIREAMCPGVGGGNVLADWTVALPEDWRDAGRWDSTTLMFLTLSARVNSSPP